MSNSQYTDTLGHPLNIGDVVLFENWGLMLGIVDSFTPKGFPRILIKSSNSNEAPHLYVITHRTTGIYVSLEQLHNSKLTTQIQELQQLYSQGAIK